MDIGEIEIRKGRKLVLNASLKSGATQLFYHVLRSWFLSKYSYFEVRGYRIFSNMFRCVVTPTEDFASVLFPLLVQLCSPGASNIRFYSSLRAPTEFFTAKWFFFLQMTFKLFQLIVILFNYFFKNLVKTICRLHIWEKRSVLNVNNLIF